MDKSVGSQKFQVLPGSYQKTVTNSKRIIRKRKVAFLYTSGLSRPSRRVNCISAFHQQSFQPSRIKDLIFPIQCAREVYKIFEKNRFFVLKFWQNRGLKKITPGVILEEIRQVIVVADLTMAFYICQFFRYSNCTLKIIIIFRL